MNVYPQFAPETFVEQTQTRSLILLSPRLRSRNALLAWFLSAGSEAYYYALTQAMDLHTFLGQLAEGLRDFDPKFGAQSMQAASSQAEPAECADALVADLQKAHPKPTYLVVDNADLLLNNPQVSQKTLLIFFGRLAEALPSDLKVVVNSRLLDYQMWAKMVHEGTAFVFGDDMTLDEGIFNPNRPAPAHLEVYGLAAGYVFVDGKPITTWDGPLPRNLFYFFVDHPMVTRDEVFQTFWPDLPVKEATNVFHVTKRKISERLGYELTQYSGGFYRPSGQMAVHYDVARFESIIESARLNPPDDPQVWYNAIKLYRTPFLYKNDMAWVVKRREQLRLAYAEALIGIARLYRTQNDTERSIHFYLRAMREVPQREDIHRELMSLYSMRGEVTKAIAQYEKLSEILRRTLGIQPSKATQALYNKIRAGKV
ncbi:MAG: bacterial transcriptional activator domain-containing protein [Anaerolineae bacterium]|nr:bacterial transcriptional activator domain-containing protein [Anaerolineae bacterium]MDW8299055.1 bacterial transcriptional activator domain-containing protein [Anaerolineae bacterium]